MDIKPYYYPIDDLENGLVYEYHPVSNDSLPVEYWFFKKMDTDTATYFFGQYYDHNFTVRQFFNAEVVSNGLLMNDYAYFDFDSLRNPTQQTAEILVPNFFPFEVKDSSSVFLFKLKWLFPELGDAYREFIRNRRFKGNTIYSFKGKEKECIEFHNQELVDDSNNGHWENQFFVKEIYAKDLGLVYYKKEYSKDFIEEYELVDTFSLQTFEQKFKDYFAE